MTIIYIVILILNLVIVPIDGKEKFEQIKKKFMSRV